MIVKYLYDFTNKGKRPFATLVATGPGEVGVAICSTRDSFQKKRGRQIAKARALKGCGGVKNGQMVAREVTRKNGEVMSLEESVFTAYGNMVDRSERYFGVPCPDPLVGFRVSLLYPEHGTGRNTRREGIVNEIAHTYIMVQTPTGYRQFLKDKIKDMRRLAPSHPSLAGQE